MSDTGKWHPLNNCDNPVEHPYCSCYSNANTTKPEADPKPVESHNPNPEEEIASEVVSKWIKAMESESRAKLMGGLEQATENWDRMETADPNLLVSMIAAALSQAKAEVEKEFIREFCNDHNGQIRWLRSVALSEQDLLDKILEFFEAIRAKAKEKK